MDLPSYILNFSQNVSMRFNHVYGRYSHNSVPEESFCWITWINQDCLFSVDALQTSSSAGQPAGFRRSLLRQVRHAPRQNGGEESEGETPLRRSTQSIGREEEKRYLEWPQKPEGGVAYVEPSQKRVSLNFHFIIIILLVWSVSLGPFESHLFWCKMNRFNLVVFVVTAAVLWCFCHSVNLGLCMVSILPRELSL